MIPKYPVELSDAEGIVDALNYVLSGPAGLGQNFDGFSDYNPLIIRPTFARPFTLPVDTTLDANWFIELTATATTVVGGNPSNMITIDFTNVYGWTDPPFQFGDRLRLSGFVASGVDPDFWNGTYYVFSSTTTSVTLYTSGTYTWPTVTTLGGIFRDYVDTLVSTDCLAEVQVDSYTQRIFITAQVEFTYDILFTSLVPPYYTNTTFDIVVQVNRYKISRNTNGNQIYSFQQTISQKILSETYGTPPAGEASAIFTTVIDEKLNFGSYAYILEIAFVTNPSLSDGNSPGTAGFGGSLGWLLDYGFQTTTLPVGTVGNLQVQTDPSGTTYTGVVPVVLTGSGASPVLDVTVYPNIYEPLYVVGETGGIPDGTVELTLNTTSSASNLNFKPGDQLKILGTDIGGATPLNDLYFTVTETTLRSSAVPGKFIMGLRNLTTQVIKE